MIIYGSRIYGKKDVVRGAGSCEHCGEYTSHESYSGRKFGHLYFIPLLPLGGPVRVIKECQSCKHGNHVSAKHVPEITARLRDQSDYAIAALISGRDTFEFEGETFPCAETIANNVDALLGLNAGDYVELSLEAMKQKELSFAYQLSTGEHAAFQGNKVEALLAFASAAELDASSAAPLLGMAAIHFHEGRYEKARELYERAMGLSANQAPALFGLLGVFDALNEHALLAETYEACFNFAPDFAKDKKVRKQYKRACKKAGRGRRTEF